MDTSRSLTRSEVITLVNNANELRSLQWQDRHLPLIAPNCHLEDLVLPQRVVGLVQNLIATKAIETVSDLKKFSIGTLQQVDNFGMLSLISLLTAILPFIDQEISPTSQSPAVSTASFQRVAFKLCVHAQGEKIRCNDRRLSRFITPIMAHVNSHNAYDGRIAPSAHLKDLGTLLVQSAGTMGNQEAIVVLATKLRREIIRCNRLSLETELTEIAECWEKGRNLQLIRFFYGWNGEPPATLQSTGEHFGGVTRERVRQITTKFERCVQQQMPFAPVLDKVLARAGRQIRCSATDLEKLLEQHKGAGEDLSIESLAAAAELLGRDGSHVLATADRAVELIRQDSERCSRILRIARRLTSTYGLNTTDEVLERLGMEEIYFKKDRVVGILDSSASIVWLDSTKKWFTDSASTRNHLITVLGKLLSVAPRIHLSEMRQVVSSDPRGLGFAPPKEVLVEFCKSAWLCNSDGEFITSVSGLPPQEYLSEAEQILWNVFKNEGPLLKRFELERKCTARGMNPSTLSLHLTRSPIIAKYGTGIYGIVGGTFTQTELDMLNTPNRERRLEHGWKGEYRFWTLSTLSKGELVTGIVAIPSTLRRVMYGRFILRSHDGSDFGFLVVAEQGVWGLTKFFRSRGGEPGDGLLLNFDRRSHTVVALVGSFTKFQNECSEIDD